MEGSSSDSSEDCDLSSLEEAEEDATEKGLTAFSEEYKMLTKAEKILKKKSFKVENAFQ